MGSVEWVFELIAPSEKWGMRDEEGTWFWIWEVRSGQWEAGFNLFVGDGEWEVNQVESLKAGSGKWEVGDIPDSTLGVRGPWRRPEFRMHRGTNDLHLKSNLESSFPGILHPAPALCGSSSLCPSLLCGPSPLWPHPHVGAAIRVEPPPARKEKSHGYK